MAQRALCPPRCGGAPIHPAAPSDVPIFTYKRYKSVWNSVNFFGDPHPADTQPTPNRHLPTPNRHPTDTLPSTRLSTRVMSVVMHLDRFHLTCVCNSLPHRFHLV